MSFPVICPPIMSIVFSDIVWSDPPILSDMLDYSGMELPDQLYTTGSILGGIMVKPDKCLSAKGRNCTLYSRLHIFCTWSILSLFPVTALGFSGA